jgi:hypothetical protein
VLEEEEVAERDGVKRGLDENGLPSSSPTDAWREQAARRVERMIGELPRWYTATPEELVGARQEWLERMRAEWDAQGIDPPDIPLEYLRREHMYD